MINSLIDLTRLIPKGRTDINGDTAKKYFITEVLPFVGAESLQRLITANESDDLEMVRLEMMRMFLEAELTRPLKPGVNNKLNLLLPS